MELGKAICAQIEFYFCDANLRRDGFMAEIVKENDGYVKLERFLDFNKIKSMTMNVAVIEQAVAASELLILSTDGFSVRRRTPFLNTKDVDNCTIYIEQIPLDSTHESIRVLFEEFGTVEYVSLPRHAQAIKNQQPRLKGFGFVDFAESVEAERACKAFQKTAISTDTSTIVVTSIGPTATTATVSRPNWRVMPKKEWLRLKEEYKVLQRKQFTLIKQIKHDFLGSQGNINTQSLKNDKQPDTRMISNDAVGSSTDTTLKAAATNFPPKSTALPLPIPFVAGVLVKLENLLPNTTKTALKVRCQ